MPPNPPMIPRHAPPRDLDPWRCTESKLLIRETCSWHAVREDVDGIFSDQSSDGLIFSMSCDETFPAAIRGSRSGSHF